MDRFIEENRAYVDKFFAVDYVVESMGRYAQESSNQEAFNSADSLFRWVTIRLNLVVALFITVTSLLLVLTPIPPAVAGVALVYSMTLTSNFQWCSTSYRRLCFSFIRPHACL